MNETHQAALRRVLEAALDVARAGEEATPPVPAPASLRHLFGHRRLRGQALEEIRETLDSDPPFRARVAAAVAEVDVGRGGWLWLERPVGWETELAELRARHERDLSARSDERSQRRESRKAERAEEKAAEAEGRAAEAEAGESAARSARDEALRARRQAQQEAKRMLAEKAEVERALEAAEERSSALGSEVDDKGARLVAVESEVARLRAELEERAVVGERGPGPAELEGLADAAADACRAAEELAATAAAAAEMARTAAAKPQELSVDQSEPVLRARVRRTPTELPAGVLGDSIDAAEHLCRVPGMVLVVDGYNVSMTKWPDAPIPEQRDRLVGWLGELATRCGVRAHVVFDGADGQGWAGLGGRDVVQVEFSAPGVTADARILELIDVLTIATPVTVVTSDREVRDGARDRGANVVGAGQFLGLLAR